MADETPDYAALSPPDSKAASDYTWQERRAELFQLIEEAGHPRNLRRSQRELAKRYGVSQTQIHKDMQRLREYQRERAGDWAISTTRWLGDRAVSEIIEQAKQIEQQAQNLEDVGESTQAARLREQAAKLWQAGVDTQMDYNDFLFKLGQLEEAPDELKISGEAGDVYMDMLRQAHEENEQE